MSPLEGLRILDLTRLLPGPYLTLLLADLGADVVKVEDPRGGDPLRQLGPPDAAGRSSLFEALNRGKRSVALDLRGSAGREAFGRLVGRADVLVEGFRPGVMDRLGLGYPALAERHPRLVYLALSGYGSTGPLRERAGHDLCYVARSGVLGYGAPDGAAPGDPGAEAASAANLSGLAVADIGGALVGAVGLLAALQERARTGRGRFVDVSLCESSLAFLHMQLGARLVLGAAGRPLERGRDFLHGAWPCYGLYRTRDGRRLAVAALEPKFWSAFCAAVGLEDLAGSGWAEGEEGRRVRARVEAVVGARTLAEWESFLAGRDLCCEPVREGDELLEPAVAREGGLFLEVPDPAGGPPVRHLKTPVRLGEPAARPAPALGEHTRELLAEAGLAPAQIAAVEGAEDGFGAPAARSD